MIKLFQRFCLWLACDSNVPMGRITPYVMGLGLGRMPNKVKETGEKRYE